MQLTIRPEEANDAEAIHRLTVDAFLHAPHSGHTEQFIVRELRRSGALTVSLVAVLDGRVVGHVAVSPVRISDGAEGWFGLGPISVSPEHQREGIGGRLMREALDRLRSASANGCVVLGDPGYYGRFGFKAIDGLILPGVRVENFQAISFGSSLPQGVVSYHEAFNARE